MITFTDKYYSKYMNPTLGLSETQPVFTIESTCVTPSIYDNIVAWISHLHFS